MSCCREGSSPDVTFYKMVDDVALTVLREPDRFRADLQHHVKGEKLKRLLLALKMVDFQE